MAVSSGGPAPTVVGATRPFGTVLAVAGLRDAISRFQTLVVLGIVFGALSLASNAWSAVWNLTAPGPYPLALGTMEGLSLLATILIGISFAIIVLIGLVVAITGFVAWRRSSRDLVSSGAEFGEPHRLEAVAAWEDSRRALLWVFGAIGVAIVLGIALGITDGALILSGRASLPSEVFSGIIGLGSGTAIVLSYYYGSRQLVGSFRTLTSDAVRLRMESARNLILLGAMIGVVGSLSSILWPIEALSLAAGVLILIGISRILAEYDGWLAVQPGRMAPPTVPFTGPARPAP